MRPIPAVLMAAWTTGALAQGVPPKPTFDMTADTFKASLNRVVRADGGDPIRSCRPARSIQVCTFGDAAYQRSVAAFKQLDMMNGRFEQKTKLELTTSGGKLAEFRVMGERSDMPNMLGFIGLTMNALMVLDPKLAADDTKEQVEKFDLMRGDAAPDIGRERMDIRPYAMVTCNQWPSRQTLRMECVFTPRS